jgi:hypothetical protein
VKFLAISPIIHRTDPVTGAQTSTNDRVLEVIDNALLAVELGSTALRWGSGTSGPSSRLARRSWWRIAALTSRIRLFTAVTTLNLPDPACAYEDSPTNGSAERELFHVAPEHQGIATPKALSCSARSGAMAR